MSLLRTNVKARKGLFPLDTTPPGYGPSDLQSAYDLPSSSAGSGQTVAVVDVGNDPTAESDLGVYRAQYGLPACTTANGCLKKVNQNGQQGNYPPDQGWGVEESLDIDMVSATCPNCHIVLVEANTATLADLTAAENEAVALGAKYVSNSWGSREFTSEKQDNQYFNHPGVVITAAGGDGGYPGDGQGANWPAASPYVTAVGGTTLTRDPSTARGWSETVWNDLSIGNGATGSGCSLHEPKPSWQTDSGCAKRMTTDVSAVSDPQTGLAVYDSTDEGGWLVVGGTSAATPIITSVYALAGTPEAGSNPASYPYLNNSGLNDVTSGSDGACSTAYFCTAGPGYDGPTGLGSPEGTAAFTPGPYGDVTGTVTSAATGKPVAAATVTVGASTAVTSKTGQYDMGAPPGTYTVKVSAFGYTTQSIPNVMVTQGQSVSENAALVVAPRVRVSGTVTDGSGHGWPLYAQVSVPGTPDSAYTSPVTGRYTLKLPENATYKIKAVAVASGYQSETTKVAVGSSSRSRSFALAVAGPCSAAPGYATASALSENFDDYPGDGGTTPPPGWTVTGNQGGAYDWTFNPPPFLGGNHTGGQGNFAVADQISGTPVSDDTLLTSPVIDLSKASDPVLSFHSSYTTYSTPSSNDYTEADLSTDGGQTWTSIWKYTTADYGAARTITIPMPQAARESQVQIRFHYSTDNRTDWEVDNVGVAYCSPVAGGLAVGRVADANTGAGVPGATVSAAGGSAQSLAKPDAGLYTLFVPGGGSQQLTASKTHYQDATATADVADNSATEVNLTLQAGRLSVTPGTLSATSQMGSSTTQPLTITDTGGAPVQVQLAGVSGAFTLAGGKQATPPGAPLQRIPVRSALDERPLPRAANASGHTRPAAAERSQSSGTSWRNVSGYPLAAAWDLAAATDPVTGLVYAVGGFDDYSTAVFRTGYVYNPATRRWSSIPDMDHPRAGASAAFIDGKLYVAGGWSTADDGDPVTMAPSMEIYNPVTATWSAGPRMPHPVGGAGVAALDGKMYVIGGAIPAPKGGSKARWGRTNVQVYDPATNSWGTAASYPEPISLLGCGGIAGKIYCAGGGTDRRGIYLRPTSDGFAYDPASNGWSPIASLPAAMLGSGYTAANGQLLLSGGILGGINITDMTNQGFAYSPWSDTWSALPNALDITLRGASACGFYRIAGVDSSGYSGAAEQLPGYGDCANTSPDWLAESNSSFTLQPGKSVTTQVTLNADAASITQPGTYTAGLVIENDTPYQVPDAAVTFTVTPLKSWGEISGTVSGQTCGGRTVPLTTATVQIDTGAGGQTLTTTQHGGYALWLSSKDNPLTVTVTDPGWHAQTRTVRIRAGASTTTDFTLTPRACS